MSTDAPRVFADRFTALFYESDTGIADEIFAPSFRAHVPLAGHLDLDGWKAYAQQFLDGFPDLWMEVNDMVTSSDRTVLRVTYRGTHDGVFQGVPPTGKSIELTAIGWFEMEQGLAVMNWAEFDIFGLMQQIGAVPTPEQGPQTA